MFDPMLVDRFVAEAGDLLPDERADESWVAVIDAEPGLREPLAVGRLETTLEAIADFTDLKSPWTVGHARAVAALAEGAGERLGLPDEDLATLRRAALLQDIGRMGVSNEILDKPGPLSDAELERMRLHPYLAERMLARPPALERIGVVAAQHHERLDGSGYPRGLSGASLGTVPRILGATDIYQALIEERPHRPAYSPDAAAAVLHTEVKAGRLDGDAVNAVLAAAGHRVRRRRAWPADLTPREVEVLGLLARGHTNREVARRLTISEKTVGNHVEHIYAKIGASSRVEATLFAMQHGILDAVELGRG
jgi:HD-GYP domain-containing protein (c-di-GMP phosphodiesterase class II)